MKVLTTNGLTKLIQLIKSNFANLSMSNLSSTGNNFVAEASMPSSRYQNLTLGATGSGYTAPAAGYFYYVANLNTSGSYAIWLRNGNLSSTADFSERTVKSNGYVAARLPVRKGDIGYLFYDGYGELVAFKFIYAEEATS